MQAMDPLSHHFVCLPVVKKDFPDRQTLRDGDVPVTVYISLRFWLAGEDGIFLISDHFTRHLWCKQDSTRCCCNMFHLRPTSRATWPVTTFFAVCSSEWCRLCSQVKGFCIFAVRLDWVTSVFSRCAGWIVEDCQRVHLSACLSAPLLSISGKCASVQKWEAPRSGRV